MIEDTTLTQLCVEPIDPSMIVSSDNDETAYSLRQVHLGCYPTVSEEKEAIKRAPISESTLGYVLDTEVDFEPSVLTTYTADKEENAKYIWGEHAPGASRYHEPCRFKSGERCLCVEFGSSYIVFPAIIVGHLNEDTIRELYERDNMYRINYDSVEEAIAAWQDFDWDSMIVRPLVRLRNSLGEEMCSTVNINRVFIFPYKEFEI